MSFCVDWLGWKAVDIAGHPCEIYIPQARNEHHYVALFLHDRDGKSLQERTSFETEFERHGLTVISPLTGHSWWADRVVPGFDRRVTAANYVKQTIMPWLQENFGVVPPQIGLFGLGMGGQGALRLAYNNPQLFPVVAGVAPDLDFHYRIQEGDEVLYAMYGDKESARQDTAILQIHPLNWPHHQFFCCDPADHRIFEGVDRLRMKLNSIGVPFEIDVETTCPGPQSYVDVMASRVVNYLVEKLDQERRRVV